MKSSLKRSNSGIDLSAYQNLPTALSRELHDEFNVQIIPHTMTRAEVIEYKIKEDELTEGPFYVIDLGQLVQQYEQWTTLLPRVKPFYAVKCNPDPGLVKTLAHLGAGFDCASHGEIMQIISYGVEPSRIIMANPCKLPSHITGARNLGVSLFTFDNTDELAKIHRLYPQAELVLRILTDDSHSLMRFGSKFGAPPSSWSKIFKMARDLGMNIVGLSFHVGSGCMSPVAFTEALRRARSAFDLAERFGFRLGLLDIGGGFPGSDEDGVCFSDIARAIGPVLDELFPLHVRVIGEPGRYLAHSTHTLACSVYARRYIDPEMTAEVPGADSDLRYLYYINDGVYGSFNCIFFDHAHPTPIPLRRKERAPQHKCKIFGPTCDSMDVVAADLELPELKVGDWIYFENMGAYTTSAASRFNGFKTSHFYYIYTLPPKLD